MDAEDLLLRQFLGILHADELEPSARWIRSQQRADGTWATFEGGPGDLSTTIEAYAALRLAGDDPHAPHMRAAREFVLAERRYRGEPRLHPDLARAVRRVVMGRSAGHAAGARPAAQLGAAERLRLGLLGPADGRADHRRRHAAARPPAAVHPGPSCAPAREPPARGPGACSLPAFGLLDRALKLYHQSPIKPGREFAMRRAAEWIIARQEDDGGWGGIQPPWVYSDPRAAPARLSARTPGAGRRARGPRHFPRPRGDAGWPRAAAGGLPVAGMGHLPRRDRAARRRRCRPMIPAVVRAVEWLLGEEVRISRRLVGPPAPTRAGRLGVRVRQRRLPGRRRHRRGRARAAPRQARDAAA